MRILLVGAGGVGSAFCAIATRRPFFEALVVADYDAERAEKAAVAVDDERFSAARVDASDAESVAALVREHRITHVMNAVDPRFVMPIFDGAFAGGADYLDMAMSLSRPHPDRPYEETGVKLGDEQFAKADDWEAAGRLALAGIGVEPGLSDVFARYAADHLFGSIDELGTRDGANLTVEGHEFAPSFSIWTTIEECLNPPVVWEDGRWFTTAPFSEPEVFDFPEGIGPVECVNVEHEEVLLMPRWVEARRATFKYGLGEEFIDVLKALHKVGLDSTDKVRVGGVEVSPRDVVAACLPDPATLGDRMRGKTCAGLWVTGTGTDGQPRSTYLYHVVDNEWSMQEYGHQCVVWQTAVNPVVALELLAAGTWSGAGVLGPEAFDAVPFLDLLTAYGSPWGQQELTPPDPPVGEAHPRTSYNSPSIRLGTDDVPRFLHRRPAATPIVRRCAQVVGMRQQRTVSGPLPARHLRVPHDAAGRRARRRAVELLARDQDGVVSRRQLRRAEVSRWQIRAELQAGRWRAHGRQVIAVHTGELAGTAPYWAAVFEAGPRAVIDGASVLRLAGLSGWREDAIRVSVPRGARTPRRPGLDVRQTRRLRPDDVEGSGVPRVRRPVAAVRAALWARSDRAAATLLAMAVQQRLVAAEQVGVALLDVHRDKRRRLLETVVLDLIAGAHSLGELDVARECRRRGLPEPSRQVVRRGRRGSLYLDVRWDAYQVVLEIDGIQHAWVQSVVPDALRHNRIALDGDTVLRMPLLGLRVAPDEFFEQVESALRASGWRRHAA